MYDSQIKIGRNILFRFLICVIFVCVLGHAQVERWVYQFDGGVNGNDEAKAIIQGTDGNIYATGYGYILGNGGDVVVVSLTPAGNERWVYTYNVRATQWMSLWELRVTKTAIYMLQGAAIITTMIY